MLHHLPQLDAALSELYRITRPGGQVLVVDFVPHENGPFQARMSDERAGMDPDDLSNRLSAAGFQDLRHHVIGQPHFPDHELAPLPQLYAITAVRSNNITNFSPAIPPAKSTKTTTSKTRKGNAQ